MALTQIQIPPGGSRVIWAKLSQAAKLVAQGRASYVVTVAEAEPDAAPPENAGRQPPRRGRR